MWSPVALAKRLPKPFVVRSIRIGGTNFSTACRTTFGHDPQLCHFCANRSTDIQHFDAIPQTLRIVMSIPLGHDRRFVPQEPLHLVQVHSALDKVGSRTLGER